MILSYSNSIECHSVECHSAECHSSECHSAECHSSKGLSVVCDYYVYITLMNIYISNVIIPNANTLVDIM
jgi:hypothetical protein